MKKTPKNYKRTHIFHSRFNFLSLFPFWGWVGVGVRVGVSFGYNAVKTKVTFQFLGERFNISQSSAHYLKENTANVQYTLDNVQCTTYNVQRTLDPNSIITITKENLTNHINIHGHYDNAQIGSFQFRDVMNREGL